MKLYYSLLSLTIALGLGLSSCRNVSAFAPVQSSHTPSFDVAKQSNRPTETLPNADGIRFRSLNYQFSESQSSQSLEAAIRREFPTGKLRFLYNRIDLNDDRRDEIVVYVTSSCGTGGCAMLILGETEDGYELISRHTLVRNPIVVSHTKTKGWRDLVLYVGGGGAKPSYRTLRFDGSAYPSNPSLAPKIAPRTIVTGTAIVADPISPDIGIVLDEPETSETNGLSAEQKASLQSLEIAIAVPSAVPDGYTISQVDVQPCEESNCRFGPKYSIVYRNVQQDKCFAIEATGGGVGGAPREYEFPAETKLFGKVSILFGESTGTFKSPSPDQLAKPQPNLLSDWAVAPSSTSPFYRIAGADIVRQSSTSATQCRNTISPNEASEILRSLSWLK